MTDREFNELAESLKRMEARFEEFAAKMLEAQEKMIQALQKQVVNSVITVNTERVDAGNIAAQVQRSMQHALLRNTDAVGIDGCKATVAKAIEPLPHPKPTPRC